MDELIQLRISVLRQGLRGVEGMLKTIGESRGPTTFALDAPADEELDELIRAIWQRSTAFKGVGARVQKVAPEAFKEITELADGLWDDVTGIVNRLETLKARRNELQPRMIAAGELDSGLRSGSLLSDAGVALTALEAIADQVDAGQVGDAWDGLANATVTSERIFREYLDLLNGVAIREVGFDQGLCRIADRFVRDLDVDRDAPWQSWTVPAAHDAHEQTLARIVRLGYPDWSIWAVPLAAHPFAYIALGNARFRALTSQTKLQGIGEDVGTLLADAFAATVAGPAYASALFTLRLRPRRKGDGGLDALRAHITLHAVKRLEADNPDVDSSMIRTLLEGAWERASVQIGADAAPPPEVVEILDDLVDKVRVKLASEKFPMETWPSIDQWSTQLDDGQGDSIRPRQFETDEVRVALNAVWLARLRTVKSDTATLAEAGRRLSERIVDKSFGEDPPETPAGGAGGMTPDITNRPTPKAPNR